MRNPEELNQLIENELLQKTNFSIAYKQIINNEFMQKKFEAHVGIKWQYCGIIAAYSGVAFRDLNPCLRSKHYKCDRRYVNILSELLTESINQLQQMNEVVLCRNEGHVNMDKVSQWYVDHVGNSVTYPGFTSTSLDWQPVEDRVIFKVKTKKNSSKARNIIPVLEIFQPERAKNEKEILFDKDTTFLIEKVEAGIIFLSEIDKSKGSLKLTNCYWNFSDKRQQDIFKDE
ncbi:ADP-ribosyltransferase [Portibacter lacus]|uniref:ADP ribosyltransferase domain-containing protein n=1 Tax=Portibacter lacus TaxID=1099794 RepID=A0AA37SN94_9BACT|nr:ADP-ribosyltransferase [Portibacter lacus]GLR16149.1 hypothetical protein GCM10007940_07640 [Portibacter lacus]